MQHQDESTLEILPTAARRLDIARGLLLRIRSAHGTAVLPARASAAQRAVCACFSVTRAAIEQAMGDGRATTLADISGTLEAGSNCGSCIPEIEEILRVAGCADREHPKIADVAAGDR